VKAYFQKLIIVFFFFAPALLCGQRPNSLYISIGAGSGSTFSHVLSENLNVDLLQKEPFGIIASVRAGIVLDRGDWITSLNLYHRFNNLSYGTSIDVNSINLHFGYTVRSGNTTRWIIYTGLGKFFLNNNQDLSTIHAILKSRIPKGNPGYSYRLSKRSYESLKNKAALNLNTGIQMIWYLKNENRFTIDLMLTKGFIPFMFSNQIEEAYGLEQDYLNTEYRGSGLVLYLTYELNTDKIRTRYFSLKE